MAISRIPMCLYGSPPTVPKSDISSALPFFWEPTNGLNLVSRRLFTLASAHEVLVPVLWRWISIRVPPAFEDIMEPEDYNVGLSLYGDKAKTETFATRFASADGSHYFYEFGKEQQHIALVAAVNSGRRFVPEQLHLKADGLMMVSGFALLRFYQHFCELI